MYHFTLTFVLKRNGNFGKIVNRNFMPLEPEQNAKEIVTFFPVLLHFKDRQVAQTTYNYVG